MNLDPEVRLVIQQMRAQHILRDERLDRLDGTNGIILVCCADCDQRKDLVGHQEEVCRHAFQKDRIHLLTEHGGALAVSPAYPLYPGHHVPGLMLKKIVDASEMKNIQTIVLSVHAPCGAANAANLGILDVIEHMMVAKQTIKTQLKGFRVLCVLHVDYEDGRKRTYTISRQDWRRYRTTHSSTTNFEPLLDRCFGQM